MIDNLYKEIFLFEEPFYLLPQKAMYRPIKNQLILSDIHLGKASHFRKNGIPMPKESHLKDIDTLHYLMNKWKPHTVLILGDLFHSKFNNEWLWFKSFMMEYPIVSFMLVEGNHDVLKENIYDISNLFKVEIIEEDHFIFSHHPLKENKKFNICGHVHPGLKLTGSAKQTIKLPCFYLNKTHLILPAFGYLTGLYILEKEENSIYYLIANKRVIHLCLNIKRGCYFNNLRRLPFQ